MILFTVLRKTVRYKNHLPLLLHSISSVEATTESVGADRCACPWIKIPGRENWATTSDRPYEEILKL